MDISEIYEIGQCESCGEVKIVTHATTKECIVSSDSVQVGDISMFCIDCILMGAKGMLNG